MVQGLIDISSARIRAALFLWMMLGLAVSVQASESEPLVVITDCCTYSFNVELALTGDQRAIGLMHRPHMDDDAGMLFRFDRIQPVMMWMKNTLIPLDMIFIRADGTVAKIHRDAVPLSETVITSGEPVLYVLELNAGTAERIGLQPGDRIRHPVIGGD